ncbi:MAG: ComK protein [Thermoanaerobacterium thermosaccharolyticum]
MKSYELMNEGEQEKLMQHEFAIMLNDKKIKLTFDVARYGVLIVTKEDKIDKLMEEIKRQIQDIPAVICKNKYFYFDNEKIKIKNPLVLHNALDTKLIEPFVLLWHREKQFFDLRSSSRVHPYAIFTFDVLKKDLIQDRYKTMLVDKEVFNVNLYKQCSDFDVLIKGRNVKDLFGISLKNSPFRVNSFILF